MLHCSSKVHFSASAHPDADLACLTDISQRRHGKALCTRAMFSAAKHLATSCFAGQSQSQQAADSSDEEGAHLWSAISKKPSSCTIGTQTSGTALDHVLEYAENSTLTVLEMAPVKDQFWAHILSCLKMPRGGIHGAGSMHCSFEFVAANEAVVKYLMEDLPLMANKRYNATLPPPHWEDSPSMNTYYAFTTGLIDPAPRQDHHGGLLY